MLTKSQIVYLQTARRQAGITEDAPWRTILRSAGHVESCKDLDNAGFEAVMAVLEDMGFRDRSKPGDHWRTKSARQPAKASERMVRKIIMLAQHCRYSLPALCERFSEHRTQFPENLRPQEAWNLIEMLKAVNQREAVRNEAGDYQRTFETEWSGKRRDRAEQPATSNQQRTAPAAVPCPIKEDHDDIPF